MCHTECTTTEGKVLNDRHTTSFGLNVVKRGKKTTDVITKEHLTDQSEHQQCQEDESTTDGNRSTNS